MFFPEKMFYRYRERPVLRRYSSLIVLPCSLKQIPFTVPSHAPPPGYRRAEVSTRSLDEGLVPGGSEPTTPTGKRPSVEIPGAYALGSIDPSLYKIADEDDDYEIPRNHLGRVWFAIEYERETEKLLVTLIKAKNLPSRQLGSDNGCDPYVRIYLMPDERRYLQSKFRKKTCNPKFEESYVFQVSHRATEDRVLKLTVFDVDRHKRHNIIGHALYPLRDHDCESNERLVIWRDLEREVSEELPPAPRRRVLARFLLTRSSVSHNRPTVLTVLSAVLTATTRSGRRWKNEMAIPFGSLRPRHTTVLSRRDVGQTRRLATPASKRTRNDA
ncbi:hypothetical protein ACOMHN_011895 [Nucella lapillus]